MSLRNLHLSPADQFNFQPDGTFIVEWNFLPEEIRVVVGQTQAYLAFHQWLDANLMNSNPSGNGPLLPLIGHVKEGFLKTYILFSASICEAALFGVLKETFEVSKASGIAMCDELVQCFTTTDERFHRLSHVEVQVPHAGEILSSYVGYICAKRRELKDYELNFARFISAGKACGMFGDELAERLDTLRKSRNTIHLLTHANQVKTTEEKVIFMQDECATAAETVEALKVSLRDFKKR